MLSTNWQGSLGIGSWAFSAQCCKAFTEAKVFWGYISWTSWLPNHMSGRGRNQSLSGKWRASSAEWSLSTFDMWHHALGTSKDAHTLLANSWRLAWLGTSLRSCHQASMSSCCVHHFIHSVPSIGEGSGIEVHRRLSPTSVPAGSISFSLRNSWI